MSTTKLDLSSQTQGILSVNQGGSGTTNSFTSGSLIFAGSSGTYSQDNSNLFWDNTNKGLGVGTAAITSSLDVVKFTSIDGATHSFRALSADNLQGDIGDAVNPNNDLVIDSTGAIQAGQIARNGSSIYQLISYSDPNNGNALLALKTGEGTFDNPLPLQPGDFLGQIVMGGSVGTHPIGFSSITINGVAQETFTSTTRGASLQFRTTTNGTASRRQRLEITHDGAISFTAPLAPPSVSPGNRGTIYYDSGSQTFQVSQNNGAYTPLLVGSTYFIDAVAAPGANTTIYAWTGTAGASEAAEQYSMPRAGTISNLYVGVSSATAALSSTTITLRKNGVDTSLAVSFGAGVSTVQSDTTDVVTFIAGDLIDLKVTSGTVPAGAVSFQPSVLIS